VHSTAPPKEIAVPLPLKIGQLPETGFYLNLLRNRAVSVALSARVGQGFYPTPGGFLPLVTTVDHLTHRFYSFQARTIFFKNRLERYKSMEMQKLVEEARYRSSDDRR
jgi:hypothetical protein